MTEGGARRTPWRDNLEALVTAIVLALLLKGFVVDAYRIPTGSMQPTLYGDERLQLFDRILVDRVTPLFRAPERFEVVVFRYPLDRSKNFVKRVAGVGPEELDIRDGDLFRRDDDSQPWEIVRKPRRVQESLLRELDREQLAEPLFGDAPSAWHLTGRSVFAPTEGRARYRPQDGSIRDSLLDGYPDVIADALSERLHDFGHNLIADLRVAATISPEDAATRVWIELVEGRRRFRFEVAGPTGIEGAGSARIIELPEDGAAPRVLASSERSFRIRPGDTVRLVAQNIDDLLELSIDGAWVLAAPIEASNDQRAEIFVGVDDAGARFEDLRAWRDIYYSTERAVTGRVTVPAGHYYMLGDNSADSSDSREWRLTRFAVVDAEGTPSVVRGNTRSGENPRTIGLGRAEGPLVRFRDEWGELHWMPQADARRIAPEEAPFVPREAIVGRAWAVFWPWSPRYDLLRLRWIR